jgi:hypothetical protein
MTRSVLEYKARTTNITLLIRSITFSTLWAMWYSLFLVCTLVCMYRNFWLFLFLHSKTLCNLFFNFISSWWAPKITKKFFDENNLKSWLIACSLTPSDALFYLVTSWRFHFFFHRFQSIVKNKITNKELCTEKNCRKLYTIFRTLLTLKKSVHKNRKLKNLEKLQKISLELLISFTNIMHFYFWTQ